MKTRSKTAKCGICRNENNTPMIECEKCGKTAHAECANVESQTNWKCESCSTDAIKQAKSCTSSQSGSAKSRRMRELELAELDETERLRSEFIAKKYAILRQYEKSDCGWEDAATEIATIQRVKQWAETANERYSARGKATPAASAVCPPAQVLSLTASQSSARQVVARDLPVFTGRSEEWPLFLSSFETSTKLCGYTDEENLLRLQRALKGRAMDSVRSMLLIPSLVPQVMSTLRMLFGRPEHIINSLLVKLRATPQVNGNKLESLINFATEVKNTSATMVAANLIAHLNNPILLDELVQKLPANLKLEWARYARSSPYTNLNEFSEWLSTIAEDASTVVSIVPADNERRKPNQVAFHEERRERPLVSLTPMTATCVICSASHLVANCDRFKNLAYGEKWTAIKQNKLCRSCLKQHDLNFCRERKVCGIGGCTAKHHQLLHKPEQYPEIVAIQPVVRTSNVLFKILPITLYGNNSSIDVYAFLDDGSGPTLIEKSVLDEIQVHGIKSDLCLRWTDGSTRTECNSQRVELSASIQGKANKKMILKDVRSVKKLDLPTQTLAMSELSEQFGYLKGLKVDSYENASPKIIIGLNNSALTMPLKFKEGKSHEPIAIKTRLGWTVSGVLNRETTDDINTNLQLHICECDDDVALHKLFIDNIKLENACVETPCKSKHQLVGDVKIQDCISRYENRFVAKLLWKSEGISLPDNYEMALRRLECFERKLSKDPVLKTSVKERISLMTTKGYIRRLSKEEVSVDHPRKWYLPIFAVRNPNKPDKIRIVWDAAAEHRGVSLNSCIDKGPDLLTPLIDVLFNFRTGKIGITGDISDMFHRVEVEKIDQQSQRFLWRDCETNREPDVMVLQVMSFGATCSPAVAQQVKNNNAEEYKNRYPRAAKSILMRHYVDDMLDSVNTEEEAIQLANEVREIHKNANFHIRNFRTNSERVTRAIGEGNSDDSFCRAGKTVDQTIEVQKVLGLWWRTTRDTFTFDLKYTKASAEILRGDKLPTKRQLLRLLMSIFDPLGFLAFYTVQMKILMQDIWRSGIGWDDTIPTELIDAWSNWRAVLGGVQGVNIPRCYFTWTNCDESQVELHIFVDASEKAYAAAAYFRIVLPTDIETCLVSAKTKVAPIKPVSIPRMELLAAVMGARLGNSIVKAHDLQINATYYWCDSKTVLSWIRSDPRKFKQFVMFRVAEIQETTNAKEWRYVSTKSNVADLATKWSQTPNFSANSIWFNGPPFLRMHENCWPEERITISKHMNEEVCPVAVHIQIDHPSVVDPERFSKWERLLRCMAYVRRFITRLQAAVNVRRDKHLKMACLKSANLTSDELLWAQEYLWRMIQRQAFQIEMQILQQNPNATLSKTSPLRKLSPFIDKHGIIRMRGRLENATMIEDTQKNPVILPRGSYSTRLLIDWYHRRYKHANHETVINEIFQKYHIPSVRRLLRNVRARCQLCKIHNAQPQPPEMGSLPEGRLAAYTRPFSYVGIDFFGPFFTITGRRSEKRYGVIFTCLTCRAIHLEMAYSLSMNSCIMVIRMFINRRGMPVRIFSDNGTNLRAAEKELRKAHLAIDFEVLQREFTNTETQWTFIPPASPHMGGTWERLVRSVKAVLYHIITPDAKLSDEKFISLLTEAEAIVNSRPLAYLSLETAEEEVLTPNHFLLGTSNGSKPPGIFDTTDKYVKSSWRHCQLLADKFWKRWVAEVLPQLTRRTKWFNRTAPIKLNDVVVVVDPNLPRHVWPKGIVKAVFPGKDGQVRSVLVRTANGEYHRPANKIAVLDVRTNEENSTVEVFRSAGDEIPGGEC